MKPIISHMTASYSLFSIRALMLLVFAFISTTVQAEQKQTFGNWDVHYIAFPSAFLQPDVAKQYKIQRSKKSAVINISVLDNQQTMQAQSVNMYGTARNLLGQVNKLKFVKVTEQDSIYYLAQLAYEHEETFNFNIKLQHGNRTETLKFSQKFYVD